MATAVATDLPPAFAPTAVTITGACPPPSGPLHPIHAAHHLQSPAIATTRVSTGAAAGSPPVRSALNAKAGAGSRSLEDLIRKAAATH
jgi:hypothetical protein